MIRTSSEPPPDAAVPAASGSIGADEHTRLFEECRALLYGVAYRMVGSVADAEDLVHDAYLRWRQVDLAGVRAPREYLIAVTTRLAIDFLRSARVRREAYVGQWLPEPLGETHDWADGERALELAESLQTAFMLLLERLAPRQRAAYLLFEVFGLEHAEIGRALGISAENSRQIVRRARAQLQEERARFDAAPEQIERVTRRFLEVCQGTGDVEALLELLADDVVFVGDGGGFVPSVPRPVVGAERVAKMVASFVARTPAGTTLRLEWASGQPAIVAYRDAAPWAVVTLAVAGERVGRISVVLNPEKLRTLRNPAWEG